MSALPLVREALTLLKEIKEEDKQIKATLKKILEKQEDLDRVLASLASQPTQEKPLEPDATFGLSKKDLALVNIIIDAEGRGTVIKPKKYLGEAWHPLNDYLHSKGFEWVSAGKNSHWIKKA